MRQRICLLIAVVLSTTFLSRAAIFPFPSTKREWLDGYALSYLQDRTSVIQLRWRKRQALWENGARLAGGSPAGEFLGVGLARATRDPRTVYGYTKGGTLKVFEGLGFAFDSSPSDQLTGASSAPSIVHVKDGHWLVGFTKGNIAQGNGIIELRPYVNGRFQTPLNLQFSRNDHVVGRPALSFHNGMLVLAWGRSVTPNRYQALAVHYTPDNPNLHLRVLRESDVPQPQGGGFVQTASSPALAHDGVGTNYLAVVYRTSLPSSGALTADHVYVARSTDGNAGLFSDLALVDGPLDSGKTHVGIAAHPKELIVAITTQARGKPFGQVLRLEGDQWLTPDNAAYVSRIDYGFSYRPDLASEFALVRHQYLQKVRVLRPFRN